MLGTKQTSLSWHYNGLGGDTLIHLVLPISDISNYSSPLASPTWRTRSDSHVIYSTELLLIFKKSLLVSAQNKNSPHGFKLPDTDKNLCFSKPVIVLLFFIFNETLQWN